MKAEWVTVHWPTVLISLSLAGEFLKGLAYLGSERLFGAMEDLATDKAESSE